MFAQLDPDGPELVESAPRRDAVFRFSRENGKSGGESERERDVTARN